MGHNREAYKVGTRTRGDKNERGTYWVRTGSELAGVVSEQVLTGCIQNVPIILISL